MSATWTPLDRNTHALRLAGARLTWYPIALPSRRQAAHPEPLPVEPLRDGSHQPPRTAKPGHPVKRDPASQQRRESSHMSNTETSGKGDPRAALLRRLNSARRNPRPVCGGGLHFGPTPGAAMDSAWGPLGPDARWVLCEVDLSEAVGVGNKLKARSCRVLHEVDARGNAVPA